MHHKQSAEEIDKARKRSENRRSESSQCAHASTGFVGYPTDFISLLAHDR